MDVLKWLDHTQEVQRRLVAILRMCVVSFPREFERQHLPRLIAPTADWGWFVTRSAHVPAFGKYGVSCLRCHKGSAGTVRERRLWLLSPCEPDRLLSGLHDARALLDANLPHPVKLRSYVRVWISGVQVHASHRLWLFKGLFMCMTCGGMGSSRLRVLRLPCTCMFLVDGERAIKRFKAGLRPCGVAHWPADVPMGGHRTRSVQWGAGSVGRLPDNVAIFD